MGPPQCLLHRPNFGDGGFLSGFGLVIPRPGGMNRILGVNSCIARRLLPPIKASCSTSTKVIARSSHFDMRLISTAFALLFAASAALANPVPTSEPASDVEVAKRGGNGDIVYIARCLGDQDDVSPLYSTLRALSYAFVVSG